VSVVLPSTVAVDPFSWVLLWPFAAGSDSITTLIVLQQPFPRPFHQEQVTGALANVVFPHLLDFLGVEFDFLLAKNRMRPRNE